MITPADAYLRQYTECLNMADRYTRRMNRAIDMGDLLAATEHKANRDTWYKRAQSNWTAYETCREDK